MEITSFDESGNIAVPVNIKELVIIDFDLLNRVAKKLSR
jgi:hypothetical protein